VCRPRNPTACSMPVRLRKGRVGESERDVERAGFDVERGGSKCEKRFGLPALESPNGLMRGYRLSPSNRQDMLLRNG
jgi:hypothetical protein